MAAVCSDRQWLFGVAQKHPIRDMDSAYIECPRCRKDTKHTYRLYETKTKAYSFIPVGANKAVVIICNGCLLERKLDKKYEKKMIELFNQWDKDVKKSS